VDGDGNKFRNAQVDVSTWTMIAGMKRLTRVGRTLTGADGAFSIGSLPPGIFYIMATANSALERQLTRPDVDFEAPRSVPTYYPNVIDVGAASPLAVSSGTQTSGIRIQMQSRRVYRVTGRILAADGGLAGPTPVAIFPRHTVSLQDTSKPTRIFSGGKFDFYDVQPGEYIVQAGLGDTGDQGQTLFAVGNHDLGDVVLQLNQRITIAGRIVIESGNGDGTQDTPPTPRISLIGMDGIQVSSRTANVNLDGTFAVPNLALGLYRVNVTSLPAGTCLKSVRFGPLDVTATLLDAGATGSLTVVLGSPASDVSGVIRDPDGRPQAQVRVTMWRRESPL
jgi:hypothetical protein